jgi:hypothetical protein
MGITRRECSLGVICGPEASRPNGLQLHPVRVKAFARMKPQPVGREVSIFGLLRRLLLA